MSVTGNLDFKPKPITAVAIRPAGANVLISKAIVQRTTALRAYYSFAAGRDWMEKLAAAYVVALATRSADEMLVQDIRIHIPEVPEIACPKCRDATLGANVIRARLFPRLRELRRHANAPIHHLDDPKNKGVNGLNVEGVFDYCYALFEEHADALFGVIPSATLPLMACKGCKQARP